MQNKGVLSTGIGMCEVEGVVMNDKPVYSEEEFLYRIASDGAEIVYAPMQDDRIVIPGQLAGMPVAALAEDYHDDLFLPDGDAEIVLPETILRFPGRAFCAGRRIRCTMDANNPHFTATEQMIYRLLEDGTKEAVLVQDGAEEIVLEDDVSRIGENAFAFSDVRRVTMGASVKEIAPGAFRSSLLDEIELPAVEKIGERAFEETDLQIVLLPAALVSLSDTAFAGCRCLEEILLDEENQALQSRDGMIFDAAGERLLAWPHARACEELTIPEATRHIGRALKGSCGIKKLRICGQLDSLDEGSLHVHCREIVFEQEPEYIHPQAIDPLCGSMKIHISKKSALPVYCAAKNIEYIIDDADESLLQALECFRFGYEDGGYTILGCMDWPERLVIPSAIGGIPVKRIGANALSERINGIYPTEIVIPEGVVELKQAALFWLSETVRQIEMPASIQVISEGVFEDVSGKYRDMFLHENLAFMTIADSPADVFLRAYRRQPGDPRGEELIVISREPEAIEEEPEAIEEEPEAIEEEPEAIEEEPEAIEEEPEAIEEEPEAIEEEPEAIEEEPEAIEEEPEAIEEEPEVIEEEPEAIEEEPEAIEEEPEVIEEEPEVIEEEPEAIEEEPEAIEEEPEVIEEEPEVIEEEPEVIEEEPEVIEEAEEVKEEPEMFASVPEITVVEPEIEDVEPQAVALETEAPDMILPTAAAILQKDKEAGLWKVSRKKGLVVRYLGEEKQLIYPVEACGVRITGIADAGKSKKPRHFREVSSIVIPEGYTSIGDYAFAGCSSLASVVLPESLESIGKNAFAGCKKLRTVELPASVRHVGKGAFRECGIRRLIVHSKKLKLKKNVLKDSRKACVYAPFGAKVFKTFAKQAKLIAEIEE